MQGRIYNFFQGGGRSLPFLLSPSLPLHKFTCQTVTITSFSSPFHPPFLLPSAAPSFSLSSPFPSLFLTLSYPPYSPFSHPLNYVFLLSLPLHLRLFFFPSLCSSLLHSALLSADSHSLCSLSLIIIPPGADAEKDKLHT